MSSEVSPLPPAFTIVIPLFNKALTIERAITSVLEQGFPDWECIVVDDGSTDEGPSIVKAFADPRIKLVQQENLGVSVARNRGVATGKGPVVAFLDADDYWAPHHLANIRQMIEEYPHAVLYASAFNIVFEGGASRQNRIRVALPERSVLSDYFAESIAAEMLFVTSSVAVRKKALDDVGGFPPGVRAGEDLVTWARLACAGAVAYSSQATICYTAPPQTADMRHTLRTPNRDDYVGEALRDLIRQHPSRKGSLQPFLAVWYRMAAMAFIEGGDPLAGLRHTLKAVRVDGPTLRDVAVTIFSAFPRRTRARLFELARTHQRRRRDGATDDHRPTR